MEGPAGRGGAIRGVGILGTEPVCATTGRGAPGPGAAEPGMVAVGTAAGAGLEVSPTPGGMGCRGPERICPGLGAGGAGLTGMEAPRLIVGVSGPAWEPVANGGRSGGASRAGADSS